MEASAPMSISIVVLTHSRVHLLRQCCENVLARTSSLTNEIIIWDNASTDGTTAYLDSLDDSRIRVVHHPENIGQNAYAEAFKLSTGPHLIELDDDVIDAPHHWDETMLEAFQRLPEIGFLSADLEDNPHDVSAHVRHHVRPHLYVPAEENGVRLLYGPTGGGCAMTSREVYDLAGGFPQDKKHTFYLEDAAYIKRIEKLGYRAAVLRDLLVTHAGGPYYSASTPEKKAYWAEVERRVRRRRAVKRVVFAMPFMRRLNDRFHWVQEPGG
jgi:GT2 family glycosyltransferase